jgi:hypothetical protein
VAIKHPALVERAASSPSYYLPSSIILQLNCIKNQSETSHANPRHNLLALLFVPSINDYTAFPKSQNNLKLTSTKRVRQTKSKPLGHLTKPHTDATFPSKHTLPTQLVTHQEETANDRWRPPIQQESQRLPESTITRARRRARHSKPRKTSTLTTCTQWIGHSLVVYILATRRCIASTL